MNTIKLNKQGHNVKMIAHRGLSGLERENTCAAFVAAGNRETYFGIETDVHVTADGQYVIIHDDNTLRVSGEDRVVEKTTMETLRSMRLTDIDGKERRWDLQLPTLREYISICKRYEKVAVLELKNPMTEPEICGIMKTVQQLDYTDYMIVISFDLNNLIFLRKNFPEQKAQYLLSKWDDSCLEIMKQYQLGLDIRHPDLTPEIVEKVHAAGLEVNCWTVDTLESAQRVLACGVDYITTDILE